MPEAVTNTICIINVALNPTYEKGLYSLAMNGRNESTLPKMNSLAVKILDSITNKMRIYFLDKATITCTDTAMA